MLTLRLFRVCCRSWLALFFGSLGYFLILLQIEVELIQILGFAAEPMPVCPVQLVLKLFDLEAQRLDLIDQKFADCTQFGGIFGQFFEVFQHG